MVEREYGYVAATFSKEDVKPFEKLVKEVCRESDFYYSETVDYIRGDVSSELHLTIFYGLIDEKLDREKLDKYLNAMKLDSLKLGKPSLRHMPENPYSIIWIEVLDEDRKLEEISEGFRQFPYDNSVQLEFNPHLTLAYVKPEFELKSISDLPKKIEVRDIKYFPR